MLFGSARRHCHLPIGTIAEQIFTVDLTAGLAYYVEINGYNTGPDSFAYKLIVVD